MTFRSLLTHYRFWCLVALLIVIQSCQQKPAVQIPGAFQAMQMMTKSRSYPHADIPAGAFGRAIEHHNKYFEGQRNEKSLSEPWEATGPLNTSGRCLALAINPQADSTVYMGTASGGLWRSRKLGLDVSWEYVPTSPDVLGVSSIAFAANDSMVMYIGTGEVYNIDQTGNDGAYRVTRGSYGVGILKSEDGGHTWEKSLDWTYQNQKGVQAIQVDQSNANIVFAATTDGIYKSLDAGQSWKLVLEVPMSTDVEIIDDVIIAACGNLGSPNKGLYRSTDGGESWSLTNEQYFPYDFQGKMELCKAPSSNDILYASVGNGFWFDDGATWLLRSDDSGESWTEVNTTDYSRWQGWFAHDVAVHPKNPEEIIAVGLDIWKSIDGGKELVRESIGGVEMGRPEIGKPDGPPDYSHSDHHVVLYHPELDHIVLFGNDGGLFISFDRGETFESANGGLQTTQFYNGFSVSSQNPDFAMGGLQDNSTALYHGNGRWERAVGGDGSWTGINAIDDSRIYASSQGLNIYASRDGGQTFDYIAPYTDGDDPIFIAPYVLARNNPSRIYAGGSFVYVSDDDGFSWTVGNNRKELNGDPIYAMAVSPTNDDVVYAATAPFLTQASLFVSTDGGISFEEVDKSNFPERFINDIAVDPENEAVVYIVMSGFGSGHIYKSTDYGSSFSDITNGLPDAPGNAIEIDPLSPDHLYFGNDLGVYFSDNGGSSWQAFGEGMVPTAICMDIKLSPIDGKIWVATHGNGAYRRPLVGETTSTHTIDQLTSIDVYPNPGAGNSIYLSTNNSLEEISHCRIVQVDGRTVIKNYPISGDRIQLSQNLPTGQYIIQFFDQAQLVAVSKYIVI